MTTTVTTAGAAGATTRRAGNLARDASAGEIAAARRRIRQAGKAEARAALRDTARE